MKEFNKFLISFKAVRTEKTQTQLKREQILKKLYKKYYNA